jgi:hypothetical protein
MRSDSISRVAKLGDCGQSPALHRIEDVLTVPDAHYEGRRPVRGCRG